MGAGRLRFRWTSTPGQPDAAGARGLFASGPHLSALHALLQSVRAGTACTVLTGAPGLAKTAALNVLAGVLAAEPEPWAVLRIRDPAPPPLDLQRLIAAPFGVADAAGLAPDVLARRLAAGETAARPVVLLIDDAQRLPLATLLYLRLACALFRGRATSGRTTGLQVVLAGPPALLAKLGHPDLAGGFIDTAGYVALQPLPPAEMRAYLAGRLADYGGSLAGTFTRGAVAALVAAAEGVPRQADMLLAEALDLLPAGRRRITGSMLRAALEDGEDAALAAGRLRWRLAAGLALATGLGILVWRGLAGPLHTDQRQEPAAASVPGSAQAGFPSAAPAADAAAARAAAADAGIVRLLGVLDAEIAADHLTAPANDNAVATLQQLEGLIQQASEAGRQRVETMDTHFAEQARLAEQAGRMEVAQRFRGFAGLSEAPAQAVATPPPAAAAQPPESAPSALPQTAPIRVALLYDRTRPAAQALADDLAAALRAGGVQVSGAQAADRSGTAQLQVRYFFNEDRDGAAAVAQRLSVLTQQDATVARARRQPMPPPGAVDALLP